MGLSWRYIFAVLGAIGMAIIYGQKVNLSIAINAMVNKTALMEIDSASHGDDEHEVEFNPDEMCYVPGGIQQYSISLSLSYNMYNRLGHLYLHKVDGPFLWTEQNKGLILGSYFWGYLVTQIPGGRIAELFSGKWVFLVAVLMSSLPTVLTPPAAYLGGFKLVIFMRIIEGFGGGLTFPAMNVLISKWAPSSEKSTLASIIYGVFFLCRNVIREQYCLYLLAGLALIWCVVWMIFVTDTPETHKFISESEKEFITSSHPPAKKGKKLTVPWKNIFTSVPFWGIIIAHFCNNFAWYMLLVELPVFMSDGLGFAIKENAGLSSVPFICNWLFSIVYSNRLDWARSKGYISTTNARKLSMGIASLIPSLCLIAVCLSGCNKTAVVTFMIVGTGFFGSMFAGVFSNHSDIASNYAGVLMGITNMIATIPGFVVPAVVGSLTHGTFGLAPWHLIFYTTSGILLLELGCMITPTMKLWDFKLWKCFCNSLPINNIMILILMTVCKEITGMN
ncbi:SLC17A [Lepeophtheirus salmonis]|uniref:SLC17A n=1 Tax=Lepeophtheirus salmonis TaxID=72036 RepID=A0A7R8H1I4_LEPSM|nr:SLC17A [Lepeophtheirus salmonis]CAF2810057.1 SLC17A [Lepeophtheirus salmonis]